MATAPKHPSGAPLSQHTTQHPQVSATVGTRCRAFREGSHTFQDDRLGELYRGWSRTRWQRGQGSLWMLGQHMKNLRGGHGQTFRGKDFDVPAVQFILSSLSPPDVAGGDKAWGFLFVNG